MLPVWVLSYWLSWLELKSTFSILLNSVLHSNVVISWWNVSPNTIGAHSISLIASTMLSDVSDVIQYQAGGVLLVRCVQSRPSGSSPVSRHFVLTTEWLTQEVFTHSSSPSYLRWNVHKCICEKRSEFDLGDGWLVVSTEHCRVHINNTTKSAITIRKAFHKMFMHSMGVLIVKDAAFFGVGSLSTLKTETQSSKFWCTITARNCRDFKNFTCWFLHSHSSPTFKVVL